MDSPDAPAATGGYAQAIDVRQATRTRYISGQIPVTGDGHLPDTFSDRARVAWINPEARLTEAGMSLDGLVNVTTYLPDRPYLMEYLVARHENFAGRTPTMTVAATGALDENRMLEVEGVAVDRPSGTPRALPASEEAIRGDEEETLSTAV